LFVVGSRRPRRDWAALFAADSAVQDGSLSRRRIRTAKTPTVYRGGTSHILPVVATSFSSPILFQNISNSSKNKQLLEYSNKIKLKEAIGKKMEATGKNMGNKRK
jgi:poly(A) polymerase Pap1